MSALAFRLLGGSAVLLAALPAGAQDAAPIRLPELVVTATRTPTAPRKIGSAITVLTAEDLALTRNVHVVDALRRVPGVTVTQTGGVGAQTDLRIRGADSDHTLVLIDGVRVNDPSSAQGEFDFANLLIANIERIEILRGPQSALYGSDAIGGVVNIITKRGRGRPSVTALAEYGSYDTFRQAAALSGSHERLDYALGLSHLATDGFSRLDKDAGGREKDGADNFTGNARLGYRFAENFRGDAAFTAADLDAETDPRLAPGGDGFRESQRQLYAGQVSGQLDLLDGRWQHALSLFAARTERSDDLRTAATDSRSDFESDRYGAEYQSNLYFDPDNVLTVGARHEVEDGSGADRNRRAGAATTRFDRAVSTDSLYLLQQVGLFDSLYLSAGLRFDDFELAGDAVTYRFTAAQAIDATGTTVRGSVGSGAKAPTLFQLFNVSLDVRANPDLRPERSIGYDLGVDQALLDDRLRLSATWFHNDIEDLIVFLPDPGGALTGTYGNVDRAETRGLELAATWTPLPSLALSGAYTWLRATDEADGSDLPRRPRHSASLTADYTGVERLRLGASLIYVGKRFNRAQEREPLDAYLRVDLNAAYDVTGWLQLFARIENLFDADYEEALNAGAAGLSGYLGAKATF